jgi:hypothetical protein
MERKADGSMTKCSVRGGVEVIPPFTNRSNLEVSEKGGTKVTALVPL